MEFLDDTIRRRTYGQFHLHCLKEEKRFALLHRLICSHHNLYHGSRHRSCERLGAASFVCSLDRFRVNFDDGYLPIHKHPAPVTVLYSYRTPSAVASRDTVRVRPDRPNQKRFTITEGYVNETGSFFDSRGLNFLITHPNCDRFFGHVSFAILEDGSTDRKFAAYREKNYR